MSEPLGSAGWLEAGNETMLVWRVKDDSNLEGSHTGDLTNNRISVDHNEEKMRSLPSAAGAGESIQKGWLSMTGLRPSSFLK
jgi:hypothetical protein